MKAADYAQAVIDAMPEVDFQTLVVSHATTNGWLVHHARKARMKDGEWRTPIQGHKGFVDLVLVHPDRRRVMFVELKSTKGRASKEQERWIAGLQRCGQPVHIVRPRDWAWLKGQLEGEG
jgi:hypothetical protein